MTPDRARDVSESVLRERPPASAVWRPGDASRGTGEDGA